VIPGNTSSQGKYADQPTSVSATAGNAQATVSFTLPAYDGKGVATYVATASPGGATASGSTSPITVTGLSNGTAYTFTVTTITGYGVSAVSSSSGSVTPVVPGPPPPPPPPPCSCVSPAPSACTRVLPDTCDGSGYRYEYYDCGCSQTCPGTGGYNGVYDPAYCGYTPPTPISTTPISTTPISTTPISTTSCGACGGGGGSGCIDIKGDGNLGCL
jgi:hypothetical protein